jgi:sortase (surface protein transpeptidase)
LAAHHVTHGAPFLNVPNIKVGAEIDVTVGNGTTYRYRVTSMETVGTSATYATVYGTDPAAARILLQTCLGTNYRLLVHGTLI